MSHDASEHGVVTRPSGMSFDELPVSITMALWHTNNGGRNLRRWVAKNDGDFIRVMSANEPVGAGGKLEGHVSITVARSEHVDTPPSRMPTPAECDSVLEFLGLDATNVKPEHSEQCCHFWYE